MKILICDQPVIDGSGYVQCAAWQMADYESLVQMSDFNQLVDLLYFDPALFAMITGGLLLSFIGSHVTGVIVKTLNRT